MGGDGAFVAEPQGNDGQVGTRLQQMHGGRVADGMGRDSAPCEAWAVRLRRLGSQGNPLGDVGSCHGLPMAVGEQRGIVAQRLTLDPLACLRGGFLP